MQVTARSAKLLAVAMLAALALCVGYARWSDQLRVVGTLSMLPVATTTQFNADFTRTWTDDPPGTLDPGYTKDVARSCARLVDTDCDCKYEVVCAQVCNAYPSYTTRISMWVHNGGTMPEMIESVEVEAPDDLDVSVTDVARRVLVPGEKVEVTVTVHVRQSAEMRSDYDLQVKLNCTQATNGNGAYRQSRRNVRRGP